MCGVAPPSCHSWVNSNLETEDVNTCINVDNSDKGFQLLSDEDIIKQATQADDAEITEDDDEDESEEIKDVPCSREVKDMPDRCLFWYERQDE